VRVPQATAAADSHHRAQGDTVGANAGRSTEATRPYNSRHRITALGHDECSSHRSTFDGLLLTTPQRVGATDKGNASLDPHGGGPAGAIGQLLDSCVAIR